MSTQLAVFRAVKAGHRTNRAIVASFVDCRSKRWRGLTTDAVRMALQRLVKSGRIVRAGWASGSSYSVRKDVPVVDMRGLRHNSRKNLKQYRVPPNPKPAIALEQFWGHGASKEIL